MFEFFVRNPVAEKQVGCQHHVKPHSVAFPDVDVLLVILVVNSWKGSHGALRVKSHISIQVGSLTSMSFVSFAGINDAICSPGVYKTLDVSYQIVCMSACEYVNLNAGAHGD